MTVRLKTCDSCHRLYSSSNSKSVCDSCLRKNLDGALAVDQAVEDYGITDIGAIASATGLPVQRVLEIVSVTAALRDKVGGVICERCQSPTASAGSRLCNDCRAELNQEISETTTRMADRIAREAEKQASQPVGAMGMNVAHLTRNKRAATAFKRFNPTPRGKYG